MLFHSSPINPQGDGQAHASGVLQTPEEVSALHAYLADLSPLREAGERCIAANGGLVAEAVLRAAVAAAVPTAEAYCYFKLFYDTDEESEVPAVVVIHEGREAEARDYLAYALAAGFWVAVDGQIHKLDPEIPATDPDGLPGVTDETDEDSELAIVDRELLDQKHVLSAEAHAAAGTGLGVSTDQVTGLVLRRWRNAARLAGKPWAEGLGGADAVDAYARQVARPYFGDGRNFMLWVPEDPSEELGDRAWALQGGWSLLLAPWIDQALVLEALAWWLTPHFVGLSLFGPEHCAIYVDLVRDHIGDEEADELAALLLGDRVGAS